MTARCQMQARYGRQRWRVTILPVGGLLISLGFPLLIVAAGGYSGLRVNVTPSVPLGIWKIVELKRPARRGDQVFVCPPLSGMFREGWNRGYLRRGLCAGGVAPLIKTVLATSGQLVSIDRFVWIDGELVPHSRLMASDGEGRPLSAHAGGLVPPGEVYLHSNSPGSFDSRYFGPLPTTSILGLAKEVWTLEP